MDWLFDRVYRARAFNPRIGWWISFGMMIMHLWFAYVAKDGGWISAGGAVVIVIGVLTIARGLIRTGDEKVRLAGRTILRRVREVDGQVVLADPEGQQKLYRDADAEFRHGPAIVIVGTLINGYGSLLGSFLLCKECLLG